MNNTTSNVQTKLIPKRSGVFTLGSLGIATILVLIGAKYIADELYLSGFLLFLTGICAGITSFVLGFRTSRNQDLEGAQPFRLSAGENSYEVSADARTPQELLLSLISTSAQVMKNRKPLPEADGMVSEDGTGDPGRIDEANCIVKENNAEVQRDYDQLEKLLSTEQKIDPSVVNSAPKIAERPDR